MFLSICIPTYKRAAYLHDTIMSALAIMSSDIEIIICDNASNDGTREIVSSFQEDNHQIKYFEWGENVGPDRNFLEVVRRANGKYCWLLGSDDTIIVEAFSGLRHAVIDSNCDVLVGDRFDCDAEMNPLRPKHWFPERVQHTWNLKDDAQLLKCTESVASLGGFFSYLSSIIIKRSAWSTRVDIEPLIGTAYSHVGMILSGLRESQNNGTYVYYPIPIVNNRCGNDSFLKGSVAKRYLLDVDGYIQIFAWSKIDSAIAKIAVANLISTEHFGAGICKEVQMLSWIKAKSEPTDWNDLTKKWKALGLCNFPSSLISFIPRWVFQFIRLCLKSKKISANELA